MFFIFGGILIALAMNESWKSPFGNTFGYMFAGRMAGASTEEVTYDLIEILKKSNRKPKEIETLDRLLTDHTLLIVLWNQSVKRLHSMPYMFYCLLLF